MLAKYFIDLRFIIGLFFAIISLMLFVTAMTTLSSEASDINLLVAEYMAVFALVMIALGVWSVRKLEMK